VHFFLSLKKQQIGKKQLHSQRIAEEENDITFIKYSVGENFRV